jgi:hypothetical protein
MEMQFLRRRAAEQAPVKKEESVSTTSGATATFEPPVTVRATSPTTPPAGLERMKRCRRCKQSKPASDFAATGIYGGYCATCEPLEKADRAAARASGAPKQKGKGGRRKKSEKLEVRITPVIVAEAGEANGYTNVIKLLQKRDALKAELAKVQTQLQEALG